MSGFDENPFADPFAEPSIQRAVNPPAPAGLEDYDPFSTTNQTTTPSQPATLPAAPAPPAYTPAPQPPHSAEFQRRQEELEAKARELERREEQLRNAEGAAGSVRQNNWPPLPSMCPVGPCFYQDINVEIPLDFQRIVRLLYRLWLYHAGMLLLNMVGAIALVSTYGISIFGLSLLYVMLFTPVSYVCWFRSIYKAFKNDSSFNFMVFFFLFFFQTCVAVLSAIGVPSMGYCGWVSVGSAFSSGNIGLGVFLILVALGCSVDAGAMTVLLLWVHRIYRSSDASFAKAQAEFAAGVMTNEHVQTATSAAASSMVRNQFSGGSTATTPNSEVRY